MSTTASILLVGCEEFLATLFSRIQRLLTCTVDMAASPLEATPLVQAQQPDLILFQGDQPGALDLCHDLKSQAKLAWIYCLVLDITEGVEAWDDRGWEWMARATALERGADAYVWLPLRDGLGEALRDQALAQQDQILRSQMLAGLRNVRNHRELMRTNDILSAIALSDPLTELNNRRALDWELPRQVQNSRHRSEILSVIMLDIDYFKRINDTYGHPVGDRALQLVSSRLRHNLRFRDTLFRYGGEEFVVLLSNTDHREALAVAYRLCQLISQQPFNLNTQLDLTITISAGTATLNDDDDSRGTSLLKRADQHLLQAKSSGRNRVVGELDADREADQVSDRPSEDVPNFLES